MISILLVVFSCERNAALSSSLELSTTDYGYVETGINLTGRTGLVFQVNTTYNALVALVSTPNVYDRSMIEIVFGANQGKQIYLRNATLALEFASRYIALFDGVTATAVWLWVSWSGGVLNIGRGSVPGQDYMMMYPDTSLIANLSTVAVSSVLGLTANWTIPYEQLVDDVPQPTVGYGTRDVLDFVFSEPSSGSTQALQIPFVDRTSIHLYTATYTSLIRLSFYINEIPFFISGFQAGKYLWIRRNQTTLSLSSFPPLFNASSSSGRHWVSWLNGVLAVGWGDVVGQNIFNVHYENKPLVVNNLTASYTGSLTVPHGYFLGLTALTRKATDQRLDKQILVRKLLTDECVYGCIIDTVQNPDCSASFCATACLLNPGCTVFCLRPYTVPGGPCTCALHAQPGIPFSPYLYYPVVGGFFYEIIA